MCYIFFIMEKRSFLVPITLIPVTAFGFIAGGALNLIGWLSGKDVSFEFDNNAFSLKYSYAYVFLLVFLFMSCDPMGPLYLTNGYEHEVRVHEYNKTLIDGFF